MSNPSPLNISALFRFIEQLQGDRPWGKMLDAGTGVKSLQWISTLETESWAAVTASERMAQQSRLDYPKPMRSDDRLVVGNWMDEKLLAGEQFDTVLLDYFIGAIDGFAPYWQDQVLPRIRQHLKPDGRLYITALEPYVPLYRNNEVDQFVTELGRLRDACLLLAQERPYREYPAEWTLRQLERSGYQVHSCKHFGIRYGERFLRSQLGMCRQRAQRFGNPALTQSMLQHVDAVQQRGEALLAKHGALASGHDYVISASISE
ncbi:MAG: class I SAM-dependent methyltransferase [Alkalimonas sp.]|nr:class I SAM-dependent methyltransferase [Alkalimonas sp.]